MIIDGEFLLGVAAVVTSIATLWRTVRQARPDLAGEEQKKKRNGRKQPRTHPARAEKVRGEIG